MANDEMPVGSRGIESPPSTVALSYEGRQLRAQPSVTVAAALIDAGILACRQTPAGDRGVFCGMGVCGECMVQIDDRPGQLACMTEVHPGMQVARQPIRVQPDIDAVSASLPETALAPECLIIGGGPAGLAAGAAAAEAGVRTILIDERAKLGGQYYKQPAGGFRLDPRRLDSQYRAGRALIERATGSGMTILSDVRVWGASGPAELYAAGPSGRWILRPQRLVLATGAYERVAPFPGWTLPGVMTTGAGQSLLRSYQVAPGQRILVAGNGPLNLQLAAELTRAGARVVALVELARMFAPARAEHLIRMASAGPRLAVDGIRYLAALRAARIPILTGRAVVEVLGGERAETAIVARVDADGHRIAGSERALDIDAVCVGMGFMPGGEIARLIGAEHTVDPRTGGYVVARTATGQTSLHGVWAVGDGAEVRGAKVAQNAGTVAGLEVAESLGRPVSARGRRAADRHRSRHERFQGALWRVYGGPALFSQLATPETTVCRCESTTLADVDAIVDEVGSAGALKRLTRAGMGRCQGRFCGFVVAARIAERTGAQVDARSGFAPQLPFRPTPASVLAEPAAAPAPRPQ